VVVNVFAGYAQLFIGDTDVLAVTLVVMDELNFRC
jgi:hypothetical protein